MRALLALVVLVIAGCEPEDTRIPSSLSNIKCELGTGSDKILAREFLAGAAFYTCKEPRSQGGAASFTGFAGITNLVSGGSLSLELDWSGTSSLQGRQLIVGIRGETGYFVTAAPSDSNPLVADIYFRQGIAGGNRILYFAIDDGSGTPEKPSVGPVLEVPINVLGVGGGDVQVSLQWDTASDVDLHVQSPSGEEVFYGRRTVASGGRLDLDSNAGCTLDHKNNENIYWPTGAAPTGQYTVLVDFWSACNITERTQYRVTIVLRGTSILTYDGSFLPEQADGGGEGSGEVVTTFSF